MCWSTRFLRARGDTVQKQKTNTNYKDHNDFSRNYFLAQLLLRVCHRSRVFTRLHFRSPFVVYEIWFFLILEIEGKWRKQRGLFIRIYFLHDWNAGFLRVFTKSSYDLLTGWVIQRWFIMRKFARRIVLYHVPICVISRFGRWLLLFCSTLHWFLAFHSTNLQAVRKRK